MKAAAAVFLNILLLVLTFNAYACLLPLPISGSMPEDCSSSDHGVPSQICEAFTTIGPQSSSDPVEAISLSGCPLLDHCSGLFSARVISTRIPDHSFSAPSTHCSIKSTVLRI